MLGAGERHQAGPVSTLTEAAVKQTTKVSHQTAAKGKDQTQACGGYQRRLPGGSDLQG